MNKIYLFFKFLEEKRGKKVPLTVKLIYAPEDIKEEELTVKGNLDLENTKITSLPDNLTVEGILSVAHSKITSLPDNLTVGGFLYLRHTKINSLPDNLKIGGGLYLRDTPLSQKYTKEEIKKMIEDKGGSIGGNVYW